MNNFYLPKSQSLYVDNLGYPSYPFYQWCLSIDGLVSQLSDSTSSGGQTGGLPSSANVIGSKSIFTMGTLSSGIVTVALRGDVDTVGNTQYYGSGSTGIKGWYNISDAFSNGPNITKSVTTGGITTFDLTNVTVGSNGRLYSLEFDVKGRLSQKHIVDVVGVTDRTTITGGDGSGSTITVDIASTYAGQTSITTLGTVTTGTWNASPIAAIYGGTGQSSYAVGDLLYANTTTTLARLPDVTIGNVLKSGGVGNIPFWGQVSLVTDVSGVLPISKGGTGQTIASDAFNALSPAVSPGDIIYNNGTTNTRLGIGSSGQVLTVVSGEPAWTSVSVGGGSVTSVALSMPSQFSVTGSPCTTNGTFGVSWTTESSNSFLASPDGSSGLPSFRTIIVNDLPSIPFTKISGTVPTGQGGTGITSYTVGDIIYSSATNTLSTLPGNITTSTKYLAQTGTGSTSSSPVWSVISGSDISGSSLTKADDTNVTMTLGGSPSNALLRSTSITLGWTGTLAISRGGTGSSTASGALANLGGAAAGPVGGSGLTVDTAILLGRSSSGVGPIEEITLGPGLSLSSGTLDIATTGLTHNQVMAIASMGF